MTDTPQPPTRPFIKPKKKRWKSRSKRATGRSSFFAPEQIAHIKKRLWWGETYDIIAADQEPPCSTEAIREISQGNRWETIPWPDGSIGGMERERRIRIQRSWRAVQRERKPEIAVWVKEFMKEEIRRPRVPSRFSKDAIKRYEEQQRALREAQEAAARAAAGQVAPAAPAMQEEEKP